MTFNKELPIYDIVVDEDFCTQVNFISLVKRPAVKRDFMAFSDHVDLSDLKFEIVSEDKRIISGVLMLADTPIFRQPPQVPEEGYVVFGKETILSIAQTFFKQGKQANVNLMHDSQMTMDGVTMFESWIVDKDRGIFPMKGFEDVPDGSWFGSFKVDNDVVWELVKSGDLKGFSIEGSFAMRPLAIVVEDQLMEEIKEILYQCDEQD